MRPHRVAILGLGTVGTEVARLIDSLPTRFPQTTQRPIEIAGVGVRDRARARSLPSGLNPKIITDDLAKLVTRSDVDLVVELIGGVETPATLIRAALEAGKDVVTANKAVLAERGDELFELAAKLERRLLCEAAVAGAIPILQALQSALQGCHVDSLTAILNGTSNYVLGQMELGLTMADAVAAAQRAGFAERDPTLDLDGTDAAHKLTVLARIVTGRRVDFRQIPRSGIVGLAHSDIAYGAKHHWALRLIARFVARAEGVAALGVYPAWVRSDSFLASARNEQNAVLVGGRPFGALLFCGKGAGGGPTATSVLADILRTARGEGWTTAARGDLEILDPSDEGGRFYVRLEVPDRPGVLGRIASALGRHDVSIASVEQPETEPLALARVHLLTHSVLRRRLDAALREVAEDPALRSANGAEASEARQPVRVKVEAGEDRS